ncbi:MAG TPA: acyl-CoA desaturase [Burkholderiaceae bacterium]
MSLPSHLSPTDVEAFGRALDALRDTTIASRGAADRAYILGVIRLQRGFNLFGRLAILAALPLLPQLGLVESLWWAATMAGLGGVLLSLGKILENMEIGHNVMHAQWDWMHDPHIHSSNWEWDNVCPSSQWKHSHNVVHHTWTNVLGKDPDVGYGVLRVTPEQPWRPKYLLQPLVNVLLQFYFQWGVALHDVEPEKLLDGKKSLADTMPILREIGVKAWRQLRKDYVVWPVLSALLVLPLAAAGVAPWAVLAWAFGATALANLLANGIRNVWSNLIIFCGHFPAGVHHFTEADVANETRGAWYIRQLLGSCNISGGPLLHLMSGNLSHQVEHHLFPDLPSNRYPELAPKVQALARQYDLPYNSAPLWRQYGTTTWTIWRLALPGGRQAEVGFTSAAMR